MLHASRGYRCVENTQTLKAVYIQLLIKRIMRFDLNPVLKMFSCCHPAGFFWMAKYLSYSKGQPWISFFSSFSFFSMLICGEHQFKLKLSLFNVYKTVENKWPMVQIRNHIWDLVPISPHRAENACLCFQLVYPRAYPFVQTVISY